MAVLDGPGVSDSDTLGSDSINEVSVAEEHFFLTGSLGSEV